MSALATIPHAPLSERLEFDEATVTAVRNIIAPNAPDHIIKLVLYRCQTLGCDPLGKNIYAINRPRKKDGAQKLRCESCGEATVFKSRKDDSPGWFCWRAKGGCGKQYPADYLPFASAEPETEDNWVLQTSIDLFRSVAESSVGYRGQDGAYWCDERGAWRDIWLGNGAPFAAKVGIYRAGFDHPMYAVARFSSYNAGGPMWDRMGDVMIAKCAEALAIRRACPQRLGGLYVAEEMQQSEIDATPATDLKSVASSKPTMATLATVDADPKRQAKIDEVRRLAAQLNVTPARMSLDLEACGDDLDALLASYQARADHKPPQRGKTTPATIIDAERPAAEPAAVAAQEAAAKPRASVTRAIMAFDNTPFAKRDERLAFAARALHWEQVESFTDLDDKALEVVTKALHAEMRQKRDAAPQTPAPQAIPDQKSGPDWTAMKTVADARNFLESTAQALDVPESSFSALVREFGGINRETAPGIYDRLPKLAPRRASESDEPAGNPAKEGLLPL